MHEKWVQILRVWIQFRAALYFWSASSESRYAMPKQIELQNNSLLVCLFVIFSCWLKNRISAKFYLTIYFWRYYSCDIRPQFKNQATRMKWSPTFVCVCNIHQTYQTWVQMKILENLLKHRFARAKRCEFDFKTLSRQIFAFANE